MKSRSQLESSVEKLQAELEELEKQIQALEVEQNELDYSDTQKAVKRLEYLQAELFSRRQVALVVKAQLKKESGDLEQVMELERKKRVKALRDKEQDQLKKVLFQVNALREVYSELQETGKEIRGLREHPLNQVNVNAIMDEVERQVKTLRSLKPELFNLPPRTSRNEQGVNSARLNVERQKEQVNALRGKRHVTPEETQKAKERLNHAERALEQAKEKVG